MFVYKKPTTSGWTFSSYRDKYFPEELVETKTEPKGDNRVWVVFDACFCCLQVAKKCAIAGSTKVDLYLPYNTITSPFLHPQNVQIHFRDRFAVLHIHTVLHWLLSKSTRSFSRAQYQWKTGKHLSLTVPLQSFLTLDLKQALKG